MSGDAGTEGQVGRLTANGPKDDTLDWLSIDWRQAEEDVRRLRQRIFTASQAGTSRRFATCRS
ncbi:reverse transcriptase N-terminal domain-containing protein [Kitasatospora sp. NPDC087314]|uniref:reverse transcriptase N-terminal domain-containing protein n=1 Tax=Kitasatospora sp. NPDC087314 TaxID=3364068 RepID=UPI00381A8101